MYTPRSMPPMNTFKTRSCGDPDCCDKNGTKKPITTRITPPRCWCRFYFVLSVVTQSNRVFLSILAALTPPRRTHIDAPFDRGIDWFFQRRLSDLRNAIRVGNKRLYKLQVHFVNSSINGLRTRGRSARSWCI